MLTPAGTKSKARAIAIALLCLCTLARPGLAADRTADCARFAKPISLSFTTKAPPPVYINRLSIAGIRNFFAINGLPVAGPHERALGVTYVQSGLTITGESVSAEVRGGYCVYLSKVDAEFGWPRMEVYVASEFKPGECEYRAVLDHENQHVAIATETLRAYAPRIRAMLESVLQAQKPIFAINAQAASDALLDGVYRRLDPMLAEFHKASDSGNAGIDTQENYDAIGKLCPNFDRPPSPR